MRDSSSAPRGRVPLAASGGHCFSVMRHQVFRLQSALKIHVTKKQATFRRSTLNSRTESALIFCFDFFSNPHFARVLLVAAHAKQETDYVQYARLAGHVGRAPFSLWPTLRQTLPGRAAK